MSGPTKRHPPIVGAILAIALLVLLGAQAASASTSVHRVTEARGAVSDYWTAARMRAAEPALPPSFGPAALRRGAPSAESGGAPRFVAASAPDGDSAASLRSGLPRVGKGILPGDTRDEIVDPAAPEFSPHGKVFFTVPNGDQEGDYVCSGTAVSSRNRSVVWTAGHCVLPETSGGFATNWIFVPAYGAGSEPFGRWTAKRLATTGPWQESRNIKYDLGAAVVRRTPDGERLGDFVGGRGIGFDQPRDQLYRAYGYPELDPSRPNPDFTGDREFRCTSRPLGTDNPAAAGPPTTSIECDMSGGSSGGGWIVDTTLLSVTSYGYRLELDSLYGPYMSTGAKSLYRKVRGKPRKKPGTKKGSKKGGGKGGR